MFVDPLGPFRRDRRSCPAPREATCELKDGHHRGIHRARQVLAAGTHPVDDYQRWRTAACHESGLHGPVDASSVVLRCISESAAAELLDRDGFKLSPVPSHGKPRMSAVARIRAPQEPGSPFGPRTKDLSSLAPRVFAIPDLDARAKKRKSGWPLFSFETCPGNIVGAGRAEVLENRFLIHKPQNRHILYGNPSIRDHLLCILSD